MTSEIRQWMTMRTLIETVQMLEAETDFMRLLEAEPSATVYQAAAKHLIAKLDLTPDEIELETILSLMGYHTADVDTESRQFKTRRRTA